MMMMVVMVMMVNDDHCIPSLCSCYIENSLLTLIVVVVVGILVFI